ncbi:hypothetical protein PV326_010863 [Microctonus aethiopoides]|nr:hypothetical protein PV326_010863 [Microctonus aethiopoides]
MAIFYEKVSLDTKRKIVSKIYEGEKKILNDTIPEEDMDYTDEECSVKRYQCKNIHDLLHNEIDFFVTAESINFFERFELPMEFSKIHLSKWAENESYIICLRFVKNLPVVNDCAERGVELVQDFYVTTRGCSLASSHGCLNNVGNGHSTPDTYEQSTSQSSQLHNK